MTSRLATGYALAAVALTLGPLLVAVLCSLRSDSAVTFMDRASTSALRGLAALGISFHHIWYWVADRPDTVPTLSLTGQMGVAVFLALSGYGLQISYLRHGAEDGGPGLAIRPLSALLLLLVLACSALAPIVNNLGVVVPVLLVGCLVCFRRAKEPALANYVGSRLARLYVLVVLVGAFWLAMAAVSGTQPLTAHSVILALTGADVWFIQYIVTWYLVFALTWVVPGRFRIGIMLVWAVAWSLALALRGNAYMAEFGLVFPAGSLVAVLVAERRRERAVGVAGLFALAVTVLFLVFLVMRPSLAVAARSLLLGGSGTQATGGLTDRLWLPLARLVPPLVVFLAACGLSWIAARAQVRSPLLAYIGTCSLAIYLLNYPLLVQYDPVLYRGPLSAMQWPAVVLLLAVAAGFTAVDTRIQRLLGRRHLRTA